MANDILSELENEIKIGSFRFGHTPMQIEHFQTTNQQGNEKWEYWQHVLQLKALHSSVTELRITAAELRYELDDAQSVWPIWNYRKRKRKIPRIQFKIEAANRSIAEKEGEIRTHLKVIEQRYSHLKNITEDDILKDESIYWTQRLGRQLGASHLSRILGVSESELLAVMSLPKEQQLSIFEGMRQLLGSAAPLLPKKHEGL